MASHDQFKSINEQLIEVLRDLLATGDWEASLFLRTAHKKLEDVYNQAVALSEHPEAKELHPHEDKNLARLRQGYIKIYVSLYQTDPYHLVKWENTLKSIKEYSINRPIYRLEDHIQEMIRSKQGSPNEGYAVILIQPSDIIPPYAGKIVEDKWGHELLTVRENSLLPEYILEFVHQGRRYHFREGKLLLKSDSR